MPALEWFTALAKKIQREGLPALGFHLIFGPDVRSMGENQVRNLKEANIVLVQVVARKYPTPHHRLQRTPVGGRR